MTKIILAFPCMGKTYYAQNHPDKAIDLAQIISSTELDMNI